MRSREYTLQRVVRHTGWLVGRDIHCLERSIFRRRLILWYARMHARSALRSVGSWRNALPQPPPRLRRAGLNALSDTGRGPTASALGLSCSLGEGRDDSPLHRGDKYARFRPPSGWNTTLCGALGLYADRHETPGGVPLRKPPDEVGQDGSDIGPSRIGTSQRAEPATWARPRKSDATLGGIVRLTNLSISWRSRSVRWTCGPTADRAAKWWHHSTTQTLDSAHQPTLFNLADGCAAARPDSTKKPLIARGFENYLMDSASALTTSPARPAAPSA